MRCRCRRLSALAAIAAFAIAVASAATLGVQPYLQDLREDRVTILWTTLDGAGAGEVRYSEDGSFGVSAPSLPTKFLPADTGVPYEFWLHKVLITGLKPDTEYLYRVYLDGVNVTPTASLQTELRFQTSAAAPLRFLALGDSGDGGAAQTGLESEMESEGSALVLHVGDLAYESGTFLELEDYFFNVYRRMMGRVPFFAVPGNHDYGDGSALAFRSMLSVPTPAMANQDRGLYYSFDWGPVHFTALDSNLPLVLADEGKGPLLQWLEQDLRSTQRQFRVAFFHHTPFPTSNHRDDSTCAMARQDITPILEKYGVHLVLNGHEHLYQRSKPRRNGVFLDQGWGTVYVTTGGGGHVLSPPGSDSFVVVDVSASHYVRVDVSGATMTVRATGLNGEAIDGFELSSAAAVDAGAVTDAAAFSGRFAPGGLISIFGKDLSRVAAAAPQTAPMPNQMGGVTVMANDRPAPLLFVSRGQVNAQLPYEAAGSVTLSLSGPNGNVQAPITVSDTAPAIFTLSVNGKPLGAVIHQDGTLVSERAPASGGEWLSVFLTGLGKTSPPIATGEAAPMSPLSTALAHVQVFAGGAQCETNFAGLAPGLVGVNQVNFRVPSGLTGATSAQVTANGAASNTVPLTLK